MRFYFNCSCGERTLPDYKGTEAADLIAARDHAVKAVQSVVATGSPERWRKWVLRVSDHAGNEVFALPFWFILASTRPTERPALPFVGSWVR